MLTTVQNRVTRDSLYNACVQKQLVPVVTKKNSST